MTYEEFTAKFEKANPTARGVEVRCPAHDDRQASLSVGRSKEGGVLLKCFAGCETRDVVAAMGLTLADLFAHPKANGHMNGHSKPETIFKKPSFPAAVKKAKPTDKVKYELDCIYSYTDTLGRELYQAVRLKPKSFRQRHRVGDGWAWSMDGVERVLYRLPEVVKAETVWVVEGEKDADSLAALGFCATCNVGGAGKWLDGYTEALRGKEVVLCGDNDEPGRKHVEQVFDSIASCAKSVRVAKVPAPHKDASDYVASLPAGTPLADKVRELANEAVPHFGGTRMPVYSMADLQPRYSAQVKSGDEVSLDLSRWLPSLRRVRRLTPGALVLVIGDTGVGKTNVLLNVALNFPHLPSLLFEMELTGEDIYERAFAHRAKVSGRDVEDEHRANGQFPPEAIMSQFPGLYVCPEARMTVKQIEAVVVKSELKIGRKPVLVLLDYVQLIAGSGERYERVSDAAEALKVMAKATRTIVFVASQVDRSSAKHGTVGLHSAKDSGSLENSATLALVCTRDEQDPALMTVKVVKATKGGAGVEVACDYDGEKATITERAEQPETIFKKGKKE